MDIETIRRLSFTSGVFFSSEVDKDSQILPFKNKDQAEDLKFSAISFKISRKDKLQDPLGTVNTDLKSI